MGAADHSEAGEEPDGARTGLGEARAVDRLHNRDTLSSEAMTEMLRDLQDGMLALDERLNALEASQGGASEDARRLARGVAEMGDALARRVRALEHVRPDPPPAAAIVPPSPRPLRPQPQHRAAWIVGLVVILILVLAGFWLLGEESGDRAGVVAAPKPVAVIPPAVAAPTPAAAPPITHSALRTPSHPASTTRRTTQGPNPPSQTPAATNATAPATGFGHYGPSPSAVVSPGPSQTPN